MILQGIYNVGKSILNCGPLAEEGAESLSKSKEKRMRTFTWFQSGQRVISYMAGEMAVNFLPIS